MNNERLEVRRPMDFREKEFMLSHLLRLNILFQEARLVLLPEHFDLTTDSHYSVVWQAALNVASKYNNTLPIDGVQVRLEMEAKSLIETNPDKVTEQQESELFGDNGFFTWAYNAPSDWFNENDGRSLLSLFLEERTVIAPFKQVTMELGDYVPTNISDIFRKLNDQYLRIKSVGTDPVEEAVPLIWSPKPLHKFPTTIPFLDDPMGGGQAPGEVYALLGPSGVGKTLLAVQIATRGALYQNVTHSDPKDIGYWFYFTYESPVDPDVRSRVWSHAARIHRETLETLTDLNDLSKAGKLKPYETVIYETELKAGVAVAGEYERLMAIKPRLENLKLVDMSGSDPDNPKIGCGGVEEIAHILQRWHNKGIKIAGYIIDYAGLAVDRYMQEHNISEDKKRHYLGRYCDQCRRLLSAQYQAAGWIAHQLRGEVNSRAATSKQHHADAAECKTFCDNVWFAFNLGTKDQRSSTCRITCTKTRRSAGDDKERIVFIDGAFCTMDSGDNKYALDIKSRSIVSKEHKEKIMQGIKVQPTINPGEVM